MKRRLAILALALAPFLPYGRGGVSYASDDAPLRVGVVKVEEVLSRSALARQLGADLQKEKNAAQAEVEEIEGRMRELKAEIEILEETSALRLEKVEELGSLDTLRKGRCQEWKDKATKRLIEIKAEVETRMRAEVDAFVRGGDGPIVLEAHAPRLDEDSDESAVARINARTVLFFDPRMDATQIFIDRMNGKGSATPPGEAGGPWLTITRRDPKVGVVDVREVCARCRIAQQFEADIAREKEGVQAEINEIEARMKDLLSEIEALEEGSELRREKAEEFVSLNTRRKGISDGWSATTIHRLHVGRARIYNLMRDEIDAIARERGLVLVLRAGSPPRAEGPGEDANGRENASLVLAAISPIDLTQLVAERLDARHAEMPPAASGVAGEPDRAPASDDGAVKARIGPTGGEVALPDGTRVEVPAGAVGEPATFSIRAVEPDDRFSRREDRVQCVIECEGTVPRFSTPVRIHFPLPADATEATAEGIQAGYFDTDRGVKTDLPCAFVETDGRKELVVETTHFTGFFMDRLKNLFSSPPPARTIENVPYYSQGSSTYCWAACTQMICEAVTEQDTPGEIWDVIGRMKVPPTGLTAVTAAFSSTWKTVMRERTTVSPDLQYWQASMTRLRNYIYEQIGLYGHPVLYSSGNLEHAVVIIGYDTTQSEPLFVVNDPGLTGAKNVAYRKVAASTLHLGNEDSLSNPVVTAVLDKDVSTRPAVRVSLASQCFGLRTAPKAPAHLWTWDHTRTRGYSFKLDVLSAEGAEVIPGNIWGAEGTKFIEVSNATSSEQALSCDYSILSEHNTVAQKHNYVVVPAYGVAVVAVEKVEFEGLRGNGTLGPEYAFHVQLLKGGDFVDSASVDFSETSGKIIVVVMETQKEWGERTWGHPEEPADQKRMAHEPVTWSYTVDGKEVHGSGRTGANGELEIPVPFGVKVTVQARGETDSTTCVKETFFEGQGAPVLGFGMAVDFPHGR